jgi:Malic enzyme, NAD binding domain
VLVRIQNVLSVVDYLFVHLRPHLCYSYIFPGVGLGVIAANALTITDEDLYIAAKSLASLVTKDRLDVGCAYPPLSIIRDVSTSIIITAPFENYFHLFFYL